MQTLLSHSYITLATSYFVQAAGLPEGLTQDTDSVGAAYVLMKDCSFRQRSPLMKIELCATPEPCGLPSCR